MRAPRLLIETGLDPARIRELSRRAEADPRSLIRVLRGERVKGAALDRRIRRVLAAAGVLDGSAARSYLPTPEL